MARDSYTRHPRPILWLVRGGLLTLAGGGAAEVGSFYISKLPVTNLQYEAFASRHRRSPTGPGDDDPATRVSFDDAAGYAAWYARVSRKPMRLPTELEWEYACRGGCTRRWFCGDDAAAAGAFLWDADNSAGTLPRLQDKRANPFGLYGMLGGVWEWTDGAVLRGGSFRTPRADLGCSVRRSAGPATAADDIGFRIVRSL